MRANRKTGSKPEVRLRSALHRRGLRFRKNQLIRLSTLRVRPDIVFPSRKVAVFVDGCFWHQCPEHGVSPRSNNEYWGPKLDRNVARDANVLRVLSCHGWTCVRAWEHEDIERVADRVEDVLRATSLNRA
jgi:DNA mismatch endonuclease (patch repair protein)